ncbi:MAG: tetratricopeptide repeat protein, partial [Eubacterium sp.]|nr:tetratricopeptide repeat protein [Eubacterium sp.]
YNLGVAYELLGEFDKAYDTFFKATWSAETQSQGFYHLACICTRKQEYAKALDFINHSLVRNYHNMKARVLKAELMQLLDTDNSGFLNECYDIDKLSIGILYQLEKPIERTFNYLKLSLDYMQYGLYEKAIDILKKCSESNPLVEYYKGYAEYNLGNVDKAKDYYMKAEAMSSDYIFPNTVEEMLILENAVAVLKDAPMASYYLGNLFYDKKQYEKATECWENAAQLKPDFAMPYRNLSIAYYNKQKDMAKALDSIKKACALEPDNSRFLLELDQLSAKARISAKDRLKVLEAHKALLEGRDVLYLAYITLLNLNGRYEDALSCLENHTFHPWEGGEGKVSGEYKTALFALAEKEMVKGNYEKAIEFCEKTLTYLDNLGEGKLENVPDNKAYYLIGKCYRLFGDDEKAKEHFTLAAAGGSVPAPVRYYNDQPSDYIYYQGLAFYELGDIPKAENSFNQLVSFGENHIHDKIEYDFFAVSMPELEVYQDNIQKRSDDYCRQLITLGNQG